MHGSYQPKKWEGSEHCTVTFHKPPIWLCSSQSNFLCFVQLVKKKWGRYYSAFLLPTHKPSSLKTLLEMRKSSLAVLGRDPFKPACPKHGPPAAGLCSAGTPPFRGCRGWTDSRGGPLPSLHALSTQAKSPGPRDARGLWGVVELRSVLAPSAWRDGC